jgi:S-layer homology domain
VSCFRLNWQWQSSCGAIAISLLLSISGCNGNKSSSNPFAPDPKLTQTNPNSTNDAANSSGIPVDFPIYPQGKLQSTAQTDNQGRVTTWTTAESIEPVYKFYQQQLPPQQWEIITQPSDSEPQLVAKQGQTIVTISPQTATDKQSEGTTYTIAFKSATGESSGLPTPSVTPAATPNPNTSPTPTTSPLASPKSSVAPPVATADYIRDLTQLGVFTSADTTTVNNAPASERAVSRQAYARWLLTAYNRINSTKPTQQIKLATGDARPAFQDVPTTHPDFASIQGLAEAGLISSPLSGDATTLLFRPDAPLTREQALLWKVPLDTRQALPTASLDAIKQTWGFQDAGKIDPKALRAVLADFQNGDRANIRRVFGYTTLFQPKKTVNLGEVAIVLWYFGTDSEGLSASEALQTAK